MRRCSPRSIDSSSRIATLLNRPSKNAPQVCSSRLASRESGSFKHFMNQLRLCNRSRAVATHLASFSRAGPTPPRPGPPLAPCRVAERGVPSVTRHPHPTSPGPRPDPATPAGANDCPGSQTPRRPPKRFQQVPRADVRSSFSGRASLPRAGRPAAPSVSQQ